MSVCPAPRDLANSNQAREAELYLAWFQDDWARGEIVCQFINGRHKFETVKQKQGNVTGKCKRANNEKPKAIKRCKSGPSEESDIDDNDGAGSDISGNSNDGANNDGWAGLIDNHGMEMGTPQINSDELDGTDLGSDSWGRWNDD